jgi:hypothetical protein
MARLELTFADIVRAICLRPKMYMMHGTFGEALAMLDGYANGRRLGNKGRSGSVFDRFRDTEAQRKTFNGNLKAFLCAFVFKT